MVIAYTKKKQIPNLGVEYGSQDPGLGLKCPKMVIHMLRISIRILKLKDIPSQFAADWFHIPEIIRTIIFHYYNDLVVKFVTPKWSYDSICYEKGLFLGCPL